tara:strand:- start:1563 stop:3551 length:1989 start_codon:yes stop_codon:yes gene_type:complete
MPVPYPPNAAGYPSLDIVSTTLVVESKAQGKQPSEYPVEIVATEPLGILSYSSTRTVPETIALGNLEYITGANLPKVESTNNERANISFSVGSSIKPNILQRSETLEYIIGANLPKVQTSPNPSYLNTEVNSNTTKPSIEHEFTDSNLSFAVQRGAGGGSVLDIDGVTLTQNIRQLELQIGPVTGGNAQFTTAGTHSWTAPAGVTSVSVVCVGTGGNGGYQWSSGGGGGGGLGYKNSITVVPGTAYTVVVGAKGSQVSNATSASGMGGNSYFISEATVCGFGAGRGGTDSTGTNKAGYGGGYTGDGGGRGGNGAWEGSWTRGGGGAGGYSGKGGDGGRNFEGGTTSSGAGGGGGGGNYYSSTYGVGAGGGVGLMGEGASGAGGVTLNAGFAGRGGSGGQDGLDGENPINSGNLTTGNYQIYGGEYGGGGGGSGTSRGGGFGGIGAVRILWGTNVAFPSTNTGSIASVGNTESVLDTLTRTDTTKTDPAITAKIGKISYITSQNYDGGVAFGQSETSFIVRGQAPTITAQLGKTPISVTRQSEGGFQVNGVTSEIINVGTSTTPTINDIVARKTFEIAREQSVYAGVSSTIDSFTYDMRQDMTLGFFERGDDHRTDTYEQVLTANDPRLIDFGRLDPATNGPIEAGDGGGGGGGGDGNIQSWS